MNGKLKKALLSTTAFTMVYVSAASESYAESFGKVTILEEKVLSETMLESEYPNGVDAEIYRVEEPRGVVKELTENVEAEVTSGAESNVEIVEVSVEISNADESVSIIEEKEISNIEETAGAEEIRTEEVKNENTESLEFSANIVESVASPAAQEEPVQAMDDDKEAVRTRVAKSFARVATRKSVKDSLDVASSDGAFGVSPVSDESLSVERGAFNPEQLGVAVFDARASYNSSENSVTGYNSISSDAFGNSKGVVSLIQNTGNNVIIQNATVVNLTIKQ